MPDTNLCGCGSGLRQIRCCGIDAATLPAADSLEILDPLATEATKLFNEKKIREAEALALKLLDLAPNHRLALRILFELRKAANRHPAAEILARRLAALPANATQTSAANLLLARLLIGQGRHAEAEPAARVALINSPRDINVHHMLGAIFTETGRLRQGEHHYRKTLAMHEGEDGLVLGNLAWNLKLQGRLEEAAVCYERALTIRPDNARAVGGYAQIEAARGNTAHAAALLDAALARPSPDRSLRLLRALLELIEDQPEAALARLDDPPASLLPPELIARGQAYLGLGKITDAVAALGAAKQLQRERFGRRYDAAASVKKAARYQAFFTADRLAALPRLAPAHAPKPIFLLGFPGSGTALLEQLLANIPGFVAADDLAPVADLLDLPELANYPDCLLDLTIGGGDAKLAKLRAQYLENLTASGVVTTSDRFVTLRAAGDAWHLGLIKMLFPEAPIIHLLRHPLDVAVTNFARDKKLEADCAISLPALAQHYALMMSLIRHYRGQLTLRYLPVRYEDLIADPAPVLRQILEFAGADAAVPSDAQLRANPAAAANRVPGHAVVQKPIHDRGVDSFRKFEAAAPNLFTEIRPILAPWIDALGYTL